MTSVCGLILEVTAPLSCAQVLLRRIASCLHSVMFPTGAPVDVGMSIDIASIDMVSEVNMVSSHFALFLQHETAAT